LKPRGIKDKAGNPYNPGYYKRGLDNAISRGGDDVVAYIAGYLDKAPSDGYKKLADADSLDLACEALIADEDKSIRPLHRGAAFPGSRAPSAHQAAIDARKQERAESVAALRASSARMACRRGPSSLSRV
jgi:hypothetical protein